jgi:hypothetical protein
MSKNYFAFACLLFCLFATASCSNKQMYEALQIKQKNECQKVPPSEYGECMARTKKSYEQYEAERQEIKKQ